MRAESPNAVVVVWKKYHWQWGFSYGVVFMEGMRVRGRGSIRDGGQGQTGPTRLGKAPVRHNDLDTTSGYIQLMRQEKGVAWMQMKLAVNI